MAYGDRLNWMERRRARGLGDPIAGQYAKMQREAEKKRKKEEEERRRRADVTARRKRSFSLLTGYESPNISPVTLLPGDAPFPA